MPVEASDWVKLAEVLRARGIKGEVVVDAYGAGPDRFEQAGRVFVSAAGSDGLGLEAAIERAWDHNGEVVLKLAGVDDRNRADELKGFELRIPIEERLPLGEDEFYFADLVGCQVFDAKSGAEAIGPVVDVVKFGAGPLLVVEDHGKELMIPFIKGIWTRVDLAGRRIEVELPEGLREL
jgi:16S rRNA processing protein RimM